MSTSAPLTPPATPAPLAAVRPRYCATCGAALSAGANYCHRCGTAIVAAPGGEAPAVAASSHGLKDVAPWAVAFVALLALVAMGAGKNLGSARGAGLDAPANALPQAALGEGGAAGAPGVSGAGGPVADGGAPAAPFANAGAGGRAPDLSKMSPRDIADRLFDRVMRLSSEGKIDSAQFFATMALQNYERMPQAGVPLDSDLRYDMGRVAEVAGRGDVALAQADTILRANPTHLLGLVLAIKGAALQGDRARLSDAQRRLVAAAPTERGKPIEDYQRHGNDIDAALKLAAAPPPGVRGPAAPR